MKLLITEDSFTFRWVGRETLDVSAEHPKKGKLTTTVQIPFKKKGKEREYAIQEWLRRFGRG